VGARGLATALGIFVPGHCFRDGSLTIYVSNISVHVDGIQQVWLAIRVVERWHTRDTVPPQK